MRGLVTEAALESPPYLLIRLFGKIILIFSIDILGVCGVASSC